MRSPYNIQDLNVSCTLHLNLLVSGVICVCHTQGLNQEFFRAGEISWSRGTSINISLISHKKEPTGKHSGVFFS